MGPISSWLEHYGYGMLFLGLFLEMLALPLPGEWLMSYAGLMVFEGKLHLFPAIFFAGAGVITGTTVSYWIGYKLGKPFIIKYGSRVHLGEEKLDRVAGWFDRYGDKLLVAAYFIPGIRHVTGYFCGVTRMPYKRYAWFAYSGAVLWSGLFISLGNLLGPKWEEYHRTVNRYLILFAIASALITLLVVLVRRSQPSILETAGRLLDQGIRHFNSFGKVRFLVLAAYLIFALFVSLMLGLIQDFGAHEFTQFDTVAAYLVHALYGSRWESRMIFFQQLGTYWFYAPLILFTGIGILLKSKDKLLELLFLIWVVVGGEMLEESLRRIFHRTGPSSAGVPIFGSFPSEATLISITVSGFAAFLLVRHYRNARLHVAAILVTILLSLLVGLSRIYFSVQYPSDVVAGYVFGMVWLSLNVIVLEILRKLQRPPALIGL